MKIICFLQVISTLKFQQFPTRHSPEMKGFMKIHYKYLLRDLTQKLHKINTVWGQGAYLINIQSLHCIFYQFYIDLSLFRLQLLIGNELCF